MHPRLPSSVPSTGHRRAAIVAVGLSLSVAVLLVLPALHPADASGTLSLVSKAYRDTDGDHDIFPDTGETGRVSLVLQNGGGSLGGVVAALTSSDSDVACVLEAEINLGTIASGATVQVGSLDPMQPGLSFRASDTLQSFSATRPARVDLCLIVSASDPAAFQETICFSLPADLDLAGGEQAFTAGPDGIPGTGDDGMIVETFDVDRDGDGVVSLTNHPGNDTIGFWVGNNPAGVNPIAVVGCGGFRVPPEDPECRIDPDYDMDWHLHCPPGSAACSLARADHATPDGGALAFDGPNSLHWGFHPPDPTNVEQLSSTRFRQVPAFMTTPINLGFVPLQGDLELSFYHVANTMDDNFLNTFPGQAVDYGDVHVQVDTNPDPAAEDWGFWDKLVPFENVYDHVPYIWSTFGTAPTYCNFTPTDGGTAEPAPRGFHELTCYPTGVWSHCGSQFPSPTIFDCPGPGQAGTVGAGLWVQSRFNLEAYTGNRIRVRWIAQSWEFDCCSSSYAELGGWDTTHDDGWWIDRIKFNGALEAPAEATVDATAPPPTECPVGDCVDLDGDGFGRAGASDCAGGRLEDCDDNDAGVHPGATEVCDGRDNDCDGAVDDDSDGDGFAVCDDCNDASPATHPGAPERCDHVDNDCDGMVDDLDDVVDFDNDGVAGACDNCAGHFNSGQEDRDLDGHGDVCDNCPTIPNDTQNPAACDQRVVDIVLDSGGPLGQGSGVLSWRTTAEVDITGFNVVTINSRGERVQVNDVPIACEACITGDSVAYSFGLPKHKSPHSLFVELIRQGGVIETYGPARRAPEGP